MPPVFNRYSDSGRHAFDDALDSLSASAAQGDQAVAKNLRYDHRVHLDREKRFAVVAGSPVSGPALLKGLRDYLWERVRTPVSPDFLDPALNSENILTDGLPGVAAIHPDHEIARVLDLNGLQTVYNASRDARDELGRLVFDDFPPLPHPNALAWLDDKLDRGAAETELFVAATLRVLGDYSLKHPYHPTWCTSWSDLEPHVAGPPDRWAEIVGVANTWGVARWLLVLRYKVREAGTLCRPTQLDGGDYQWHFPSPPSRPRTDGGAAMDLDLSALPTMRGEYIHMQIQHPIDHWVAGGRLLGRGGPYGSAPLREMRVKHRRLLQAAFPADALWMPDAI